jgi:hypothetical protein
MYSSEAKFSSALLTALKAKAKRLLIQRIESGETARGIPDLYLRNNVREYWLELKNIKYGSVYDEKWKIPWRPGQKAWASRYYRCAGVWSYTVAALKDGYMIVPMNYNYQNDIVYRQQCTRMTTLSDLVGLISGGLDVY